MSDSKKSRRSSSSNSQSGTVSNRRDRKIRKYIFLGMSALAVAGLLALGFYYGYRIQRKQRALASAREFVEKKEYLQAAIAARRAVMLNPKDLTANRMMAEMAEALNQKEAVTWRKSVAELEPGVTGNYIAWAEAAIRFRDVESAKEAFSKIDAAGKNTSPFHDMAARFAVLTGQTSEVYAHVAAAAQLDPGNETYQLQNAAVQLGSPVPAVRQAAIATVEKLAESPKVRRNALRMLIQSHLMRGDGASSLKFAHQLMSGPGGTFDDRMLYLKLLGQLRRPEFWWFLAQMHSALPEKDEDVVTLLSWMNNNRLPQLTLAWTDEMPNERTERMPVCVAVAEAHTLLGNWGRLKTMLKFQQWGELEFQREALIARVNREDGNDAGSNKHWEAALTLARENPEHLSALARFASAWKWDEQYTNVLWVAARGRNALTAKPALLQLQRKYAAEQNTRELLSVFNRMLEIEPGDNWSMKNNVAYSLMLMNLEPGRAQTLAKAVHDADPANTEFAATYAMALHLKGKTDQALKILQQFNEKDLRIPATALCYAMVLAASGKDAEARKYLDIAEAGTLLPQEKNLALRTREKLPH